MVQRSNKSVYHHDDKFYSNHGTRIVPEYVLDFPPEGGVSLKQVGVKPLYEIIQANKANCDLATVLESCIHSNQFAAVTPDSLNEMIADFTGLTNLGDLYAGTKRMEHTWKELPLEVRESFDGDIKKFIRGIGTDDFKTKVSDGFNKYGESLFKSKAADIKQNSKDYIEKKSAAELKNNIDVKNVIENNDSKGGE